MHVTSHFKHPRSIARTAVACLALLLSATATITPAMAQSNLKSVGDIAEPFELTDIRTDAPFHLNELEGTIILLDFFFYW